VTAMPATVADRAAAERADHAGTVASASVSSVGFRLSGSHQHRLKTSIAAGAGQPRRPEGRTAIQKIVRVIRRFIA
jgi:hypothetical protein